MILYNYKKERKTAAYLQMQREHPLFSSFQEKQNISA